MPSAEFPNMTSDVYAKISRAETLVQQRNWLAADDCFASAVELDDSPTSRIAFASSLAERERYHDAICQMTAALDMASETGDREAMSVIYHNLAVVYRELGDTDLAQRFQQRSIVLLDDCGAEELLGLANDAWRTNRQPLAQVMAESAFELSETTEFALESEATIGIFAALNGGDVRQGIRTLLRVYREHRERRAYRLMGADLLNLSILFGEIGRPRGELALVEDAIRCFEKAAAQVSSEKAQRILALLTQVQSVREFDATRN